VFEVGNGASAAPLPVRAAQIVTAVRHCIGTRFRSQGRMPGVGLDCVGVALVAARAAGTDIPGVPSYQLGGDNEYQLETFLRGAGLIPVARAAPGDIWVFAPISGRRHLAVQSDGCVGDHRRHAMFVHAHAGLGRVVETAADPAWAMIGAWRFPERH
jgi:lipoprotein Spr